MRSWYIVVFSWWLFLLGGCFQGISDNKDVDVLKDTTPVVKRVSDNSVKWEYSNPEDVYTKLAEYLKVEGLGAYSNFVWDNQGCSVKFLCDGYYVHVIWNSKWLMIKKVYNSKNLKVGNSEEEADIVIDIVKPKNETPVLKSVYVAGYTFSGNKQIPTYWKDDIKTTLYINGAKQGFATDIKVVGDNVYVSGILQYGVDWKPVYWENGNLINLTPGTKGGTTVKLFVDNGNVYITGFIKDSKNISQPVYWRNGVKYDLSTINKNKGGETTGIFVNNNSVYVSGYTCDSKGGLVACYWKDFNRIDLLNNGVINSVKVVSGKTYLVGNVSGKAYYWVDSERYDLGAGFTSDVDVVGNSVNVIGYELGNMNYFPTVWNNSIKNRLSVLYDKELSNSDCSHGYAVDSFNTDVFIAGDTSGSDGRGVACYWKNGTRVDFEKGCARGIDII